MIQYIDLIIIPLLLTFSVAYLMTPYAIKWAYKLGIVDDPQKHKHEKVIHTYPVPRGGSLSIMIAVLAGILFLLPFDKHTIGIALGAIAVVALGVLDDKYNINPYVRLAIQFLIALIPVAAGIGIAFLTNPTGGIIDFSSYQYQFMFLGEIRSIWIVSDLFAVLWTSRSS